MKFKSTNGSGSLAAAYLIFCIGLVGMTLSSGVWFPQQPQVPMYVFVTGALLVVMTIVFRAKPELPSQFLWMFSRGRKPGDGEYVPRLIKRQVIEFGTNLPPTVDEVRDLKDNPRNWVPSQSRGY